MNIAVRPIEESHLRGNEGEIPSHLMDHQVVELTFFKSGKTLALETLNTGLAFAYEKVNVEMHQERPNQ